MWERTHNSGYGILTSLDRNVQPLFEERPSPNVPIMYNDFI